MKTTVTTVAVLILVMMSGMVVAEGDRMYGTMNSNCSDCGNCIDVVHAFENLPFAQFEELSAFAATSTGITIDREWLYGRRNEVPEGLDHVYYDFEEGQNLGVFKNAHPGVTSFENVSNSRCCFPACGDINEPSYVRQDASSGPMCRCIMYIYPTQRTFPNGTYVPYIHIVNGYAAFSPRVQQSGWCYYPACSAFIGFKDGTNYVSLLASTNYNLRVRAYDKTGGYLGGTTIGCNTDRIGDGPSNFTRFTMHLPDTAIGYLTFDGPFNGWHIDDLVVGDTPGYLPDEGRRNYDWAAERMKTLVGAKFHPFGLGYILETCQYLTADEIKNKAYPIYNPATKELTLEKGICPEAAIIWAFNLESNLINNLGMNDMMKKDFKEEIAYEDIQPGDVFFIDYPDWWDAKIGEWMPDGHYDEVGIVIPGQYDQETCMYEDIIRIVPAFDDDGNPVGNAEYGSSEFINAHYGNSGFVHYRSLPDAPKGPKSPYPKPKGKPI